MPAADVGALNAVRHGDSSMLSSNPFG